jgi:S1-C subfamily serine protease
MQEFFKSVFVGFLTGILVGIVYLLLAGAVKASELDQLQQQVINPVVQLDRDCSGVAIKTDIPETTYIVTALHCKGDKSGFVNIDVKERQKVISVTNVVYDVVRVDPKQDIMLVKTRQKLNVDLATIAHTDPREGEKVFAVGYPLGWTRTITEGYVGGYESIDAALSGFNQFGNERALLRATAPITGGNSGGGLFIKNGDNYELVGITDAGVNSFPQAALFVTQDAIRELVDGALKYEKSNLKVEEDKRSQK